MEQEHFIGENLNELNLPNEDQNPPEQQPAIGKVNRSIFWSVMLVALLLLSGITTLISKGAIAMAAAVPVPVTVTSSSIKTTRFRLYPGISQADNTSPVAVNQLDGTLSNLVITKTVALPVIGNVTVTLKAGQNTPVSTTGLTTDVAGLSSESATFGGQAVSSNANGNAFEIDAQSVTLNNITINAPYMIANSMTLPGLSLTVK
ncbi:DUF6230 family protein [Dictyobacter formicarum]|uniref:Baseplate protein J-like domain-containing protein n=1 Tax=Dictyobacter formicarum TaxID=2778368 RepID=A0ABQ3VD14_9CHLR|nr:DUF6230 family protein [Dictyobacter formicarum]GHO83969.1 hypothetical protein KSZ_19750 [Dictyobacter formicarum]